MAPRRPAGSQFAALLTAHPRETAVALVLTGLLLILGIAAPGFFSGANLRDLLLTNVPVLIASIGMTAVIVARQIDISIGSLFACGTVLTGLLAKSGLPLPAVALLVIIFGGLLGAVNGGLVAYGRIPAIVVTLAGMIILRDLLKWLTDGAWVQGLPSDFQWFGLGQAAGQVAIVAITLTVWLIGLWGLSNLAVGRAVYAVGSDAEAARLVGLDPRLITLLVFVFAGSLTSLASLLNSLRFAELQSNAGVGLELRTIAAVVVGGTAVSGGRGTLIGSLLGVALLGVIGTALIYLGIDPSWERAIQGAIILAAISTDLLIERTRVNAGTKTIPD
ncbi:MAG: ABC transporter permease [Acidobacteria bacterium]|nr:ABC transporter permease [Acidobacteriota bacterium]